MKAGHTLILMLVFVAIFLVITTSVIVAGINSMQSVGHLSSGQSATLLSESAIEEAMLRLLRDPSLTNFTLTMGDGTATINIIGAESKTIDIVADVFGYVRKKRVIAGYTNGVLQIISQSSIP